MVYVIILGEWEPSHWFSYYFRILPPISKHKNCKLRDLQLLGRWDKFQSDPSSNPTQIICVLGSARHRATYLEYCNSRPNSKVRLDTRCIPSCCQWSDFTRRNTIHFEHSSETHIRNQSFGIPIEQARHRMILTRTCFLAASACRRRDIYIKTS